jgi:hypothetical protein
MVTVTFDENGQFLSFVPDYASLREEDEEEKIILKNLIQKLKKRNRIARHMRGLFYFSYVLLHVMPSVVMVTVPRSWVDIHGICNASNLPVTSSCG